MKARRTLRRATVLGVLVAMVIGVTALPVGAESETPAEVKQRIEGEIRDTLGQVLNIADGLQGQAQDDLNAAVGQLATGDIGGAQETLKDFGHQAECTAIEAKTRYFGYNNNAITYDIGAGEAYSTIVVPNASDGTPCQFAAPVDLVTVSWGLYMSQWGVLPQWEEDTSAVTVTGSGTYNMTVGLPGPTADPAALEAAQDLILDGESGEHLGAAAGPLDGIADGINDIIGDLISSLTPEQISGILDFICPFQVDTFQGSAADVPATLGGGFGTTNLTDPNFPVTRMVDGIVVETPELAAAGRDSGTAAARTLGASAEGGGLDLGAIDLGSLDLEVLCVDPEPPDVGGTGDENVPASTGTGTDSGVDVAGATEALPRTGSNAPGEAGVGLALIVAGWLVLTGNALSRIRRNRLEA
ncbi:MAG: hypothetical protein R3A49_09765 [Acidimicrobiia bacterium]